LRSEEKRAGTRAGPFRAVFPQRRSGARRMRSRTSAPILKP
jgi:hypothetical protein